MENIPFEVVGSGQQRPRGVSGMMPCWRVMGRHLPKPLLVNPNPGLCRPPKQGGRFDGGLVDRCCTDTC